MSTRRIAVDVRPLSAPTTGIGRYTHELLVRLIDQTKDSVQWYLYSHRALKVDFCGPNVLVRHLNIESALLSSIIAQAIFPIWSIRDRIQLFWSPRHHLPLLLPKTVKTLLTVHDLVWKKCPETMTKWGYFLEYFLMPPSLKKADKIICSSNATCRDIKEFKPLCARKLSVVTLAGNVAGSLTVKKDPERVGQQPYILFVGTLEPRKNLVRTLTAYASLVKSGCLEHRFIICGVDGWGTRNLGDLINELGIPSKVDVMGHVADYQLQELYVGADFLVLVSLYEGFGLPLLEALQYGIPVLTSNVSSMPEVVGNAGLLVDPLSVQQIESAMNKLANDHELRRQLVSNAVLQSKKFSWEQAASEALELIDGCFQE